MICARRDCERQLKAGSGKRKGRGGETEKEIEHARPPAVGVQRLVRMMVLAINAFG